MSLTRVLKDKNRQNLRNWFKDNFHNNFSLEEKSIKIESNKKTSAWLIGMSLDFLLRLHIQRMKPKKIKINPCSAEKALNTIAADHFSYYLSRDFNVRVVDYNTDYKSELPSMDKFLDQLKITRDAAEETFNKFVNNEENATDFLFRMSIFYAKAESVYRRGKLMEDFFEVKNSDIAELKSVFALCIQNKELLNQDSYYEVNPGFNNLPVVINGAEPDLIKDSTLIEIKTVSKLKIERHFLNQLLSYYILGLNENKQLEINKLGIYFARHDYLFTFDISRYYNLPEFIMLKNEFFQLINNPDLNITSNRKPNWLLNSRLV